MDKSFGCSIGFGARSCLKFHSEDCVIRSQGIGLGIMTNCLLSSAKDQTLIWQANEKNSTVIIPKPIPWECLTQYSEWNFKQLLAPKPIEHPKLLSITEYGQGNVQINFEPRKENLTRTYSARSSNSFLEIRTPSRRSNVQTNLNIEEVDYSSTIPDLKYTRPEPNI